MNIIDTLKMSLTSLFRSKIRTFLTTFAVFIGVFVIIFLVSLSFGAQNILLSQITEQFDIRSIFILRRGSLNLNFFGIVAEEEGEQRARILNSEALGEIQEIDGVELAQPVAQIYQRRLEFKDKDFDDRVVNAASGGGWDISEGDSIVAEVFAGRFTNLLDNEVAITKDLADAYQKDYQEYLGQTIILTDPGLEQRTREMTIVGVISNIRNFAYITNLNIALTDISTRNRFASVEKYIENAGYQSIYVRASEEQRVNEVASNIRSLGFDATTLEDVLNVFNTFFNIVPIIFTIIGAIAVFVASIGIINTMIMSVFERTKEIGVMKAVGARNVNILSLFITEAGLIGFLGGLLAVFVSLLLMLGIERLLVNNILPRLNVEGISQIFITPLWLIVVTVLVSTLVGILAGLYPAFRASRLDPVKALRYE